MRPATCKTCGHYQDEKCLKLLPECAVPVKEGQVACCFHEPVCEAITGRAPTLFDPVGIVGIKHHYGSDNTAISSLAKWIEDGKVPGIRMEREGRALKLYPQES
jgi:hypothetical protein